MKVKINNRKLDRNAKLCAWMGFFDENGQYCEARTDNVVLGNLPEEATEILKLDIVLRDGRVYNYVFYGMTARKAYYSLNGSGEFYINRDYVKQMMTACTDLLEGKTVVVDRKN